MNRAARGRFRVINKSKRTTLGVEVELADSAWARMKGLLGRKKTEFFSGKGLWIFPSQGIHTLGMSFPIDVVYLDRKNKVLRTYRELPPFRIGRVSLRTKSVLELPPGTLDGSGTEVGDSLRVIGDCLEVDI